MAVALAGAEHRRGEAGMVGAVGEVLGFERQRSAAAVGFAALADQGAVEEITAVELDARFGRPNLHITPRSGFIDRSRQLQVMGAPARQHPIVVVAVAVAELFEIGIEARPDRCRTAEIHRRAGHRQDAARGAGLVVALEVVGGIDAELLAQHIAAAVEVEIGVVRQVDDGIRIAGDTVVHPQSVVRGEDVPHADLQIPRETILARRAFGLHQERVAEHLHIVDLPGEGAVQVISAVVGFQLVGLAAEGKFRVLDAVGVPAHERTAAGAAGRVEICLIVGEGVVPDDHIHKARLGGDEEIFDHTAVVQHTDLKSAGIGDDVLIHLIAVFGHTERLGAKLCHKARLLVVIFWPGAAQPRPRP